MPPMTESAADTRGFEPGLIENLLLTGSPIMRSVARHAKAHRLQILLSELTPAQRSGRRPGVRTAGFRVDAEYFYPASTIKLCAAIAALGHLSEMRRSQPEAAHLTAQSPMTVEPCFNDQSRQSHDPTNLAPGPSRGALTVAHEIRKIMLVSDNPAFNNLYGLVGHRDINERMWRAGLHSVRINHRLDEVRTLDENRRTPQIRFETGDKTCAASPARSSDLHVSANDQPGILIGDRHRSSAGKLITRPLSFAHKNRISLTDLHALLIALLRPALAPSIQLNLCASERALLLHAMTQLPKDSPNPRYDSETYPDAYAKYLVPGLRRVLDADRLSVTNKVGQAWGFTLENACVHDDYSDRSFFLTAAIYTNASGTLGTDQYDYDSVALPFMADLGEAAARLLWC